MFNKLSDVWINQVLKMGSRLTSLRIFSLSDAEKKGIAVAGWETFDQHPELIMFEGYLDDKNQARLERKAR